MFPKTLQQMSANCPVRLILRPSIRVNRLQNGESRFRPVRLRNRGGVSSSCAERWRYAEQLFVEQRYRCPVGPAAARTLSVRGLNCRFKLKSAGASLFERVSEIAFRLFYQRKRPLLGVLLRKRNVPTIRPPARRAPCFSVQHES